jgi:signal transduction histidine kinase
MRQPIHALSMLNECLHDALAVHDEARSLTRGERVSPELVGCIADSRQMRDVLKHLMSLADDFLVFSSLNSKVAFSLKLEDTSLSTICKRVQMVSGSLAKEKGIQFVVARAQSFDAMSVCNIFYPLLPFCPHRP